jgi:hypothetical protein
MGLKAKDGGGEPRELVPAGSYFGVVCGVYDIGTQAGGQYGPKRQMVVTWELHKRKGPARNAAGNILTISNFYSLSFGSKSNLRKDVEAMNGSAFADGSEYDVEEMLGKACRLQVVHEKKADGSPRDAIGSFMPLDDDDTPPRGELDERYFEVTDHVVRHNDVPDWVPSWIAKRVRESAEMGGSKGTPAASASAAPANGRRTAPVPVGPAVADGDDSDIPF